MSEPDGAVVGDAGFHGPPDEAGMVEVGYTVVPGYRRQGYARAMLTAIGSDNTGSLASIDGLGFTGVGEPGNERDGLTITFDVPADAVPAE